MLGTNRAELSSTVAVGYPLYIRWFTPRTLARFHSTCWISPYILGGLHLPGALWMARRCWISPYILGGLHHISYKLVYSNYISQNISGFFECSKVVQTSIYTTYGFKPQTKAFQHAQSLMGLYNLYLQFQRTPITCHKVNTIFSF